MTNSKEIQKYIIDNDYYITNANDKLITRSNLSKKLDINIHGLKITPEYIEYKGERVEDVNGVYKSLCEVLNIIRGEG